jgi:hypothetical protein
MRSNGESGSTCDCPAVTCNERLRPTDVAGASVKSTEVPADKLDNDECAFSEAGGCAGKHGHGSSLFFASLRLCVKSGFPELSGSSSRELVGLTARRSVFRPLTPDPSPRNTGNIIHQLYQLSGVVGD